MFSTCDVWSVVLRHVFNRFDVGSVILRRVFSILDVRNVISRRVFNTFDIRNVILRRVFNIFDQEVVIPYDVFIKSRHFVRFFLKNMCFFIGGTPRNQAHNLQRLNSTLLYVSQNPKC